MYIPKPYPCWLYHATEPARVVDSFEAHEALGDGWATHPDLVKTASAEETPSAEVSTPANKSRKKGATNGSK